MAKYSSLEMGKALEIIGELFDTREQNEAAFLEVVKRYHDKELNLGVSRKEKIEGGISGKAFFQHQYEETHQSRRQVSHFFTFAFDLFKEFRVLDDFYFKKICSIKKFALLYSVNEWLELAFDPDYDRRTFTDLLEQSGRKDIENLIENLKELRPPKTWAKVEQMIQPNQAQR